MKPMMRLLLVEVVVVGTLVLSCPAPALATDAQPGASTTAVASPTGAAAAAKPSPKALSPGVWTVLPPVSPSASAKHNPEPGQTSASQAKATRPAAAPPKKASGALAVHTTVSAGKKAAPARAREVRADASAPDAVSAPIPAHPATTSPAIAAISPPGSFSAHNANQPAASATAKSPAAPSAHKSASKAPHKTPGEIALAKTNDPSTADNPLNWSVMVYKSRHELLVYFEGHFYGKYNAVFGRSLEHGTKEWEGDRRTPLGVYRIISKQPDRRWRYFLKLNYPNRYDRRLYDTMLSEGEIPRVHGRPIPEGGEIGIHGTDEPMLNSGKINWTTGCISVNNAAIDELDALLPVGTLVIIKP